MLVSIVFTAGGAPLKMIVPVTDPIATGAAEAVEAGVSAVAFGGSLDGGGAASAVPRPTIAGFFTAASGLQPPSDSDTPATNPIATDRTHNCIANSFDSI
jgi:hypothetical protein